MRRRQFLAGTAAGSLAGLAGCPDLSLSGEEEGAPRLSVEGRWLTDPDGDRVVLRGVGVVDPWWGVQNEEARGKGYWETLRLATDESAGWHARALRVPVRPQSIRTAGLDAIVEDYLDRVVDLTRERGVYVVLDYHAVERYDTTEIDERLRAFWDAVAARYADETHVIYELFGQPSEPAGGGIDAWRTWREHAEPWVAFVRERAPETPIVVGSPRWSSMTKYATVEPFDGDDLLYAANVYPSWDPSSWEGTFGTAALDVPVFVTEWGYVGDESTGADQHLLGSTGEWGEPFREWLDAHENVNWCAATFDAHRLPNLVGYDWEPLGGDDYAGQLVKDWLAARRDDHRPGEGTAGTARPPEAGSPPEPPRNVRVERVEATAAVLAWDDASDPDGDEIRQYRVAVGDREIVLRGTVHSAEIGDLRPDQRHTARLTAVDERGVESRPSTVEFRTAEPTEPVATIPRTDAVLAVDGDADDVWADVERREMVDLWGGQESDLAGGWRALWDESALYVLASVTDGTDRRYDAVEVYLDLDHSRETEYDGEDDLQLVVVRGESVVMQGANSAPVADGVDAATTETGDGYRVELVVPWEEYGVTPVTGLRLGLDVHAVDDVAGGERNAKIGWYDRSDSAWENPRKFATVELGGPRRPDQSG